MGGREEGKEEEEGKKASEGKEEGTGGSRERGGGWLGDNTSKRLFVKFLGIDFKISQKNIYDDFLRLSTVTKI